MKRTCCLTVLFVALATPGLAADFEPAAGPQLPRGYEWSESPPQVIPVEFLTLQERSILIPEPAAMPVGLATEMAAAPTPAQPAETEFFTLDELKTEMKKLAWTKGDFKVVPYGFLWATINYETQETFTGDYAMYVLRPVPTNEHHFHVDGKSTRLGLDVSGPTLRWFGGAPSGGRVEIDFQGSFVTENKGGVLLRHAYWEVKNDEFRLLGGQTWDVISPLYPGVLSYSVGWGGGNIGYRRAQFRGERYYAWSDELLLTAQGSVNVDIVSDYPGSNLNSGDHAGWPVLEGRIATTIGPRGKGCHPIEFGVSGHIGEQIWDFYNPDPTNYLGPVTRAANDIPQRTWSFNVDVRIPVGERWGFQGEFFTGENLGTFLGGILQGVNVRRRSATDPLGPQAFLSVNPIRSTGGWFEVWYDWRKNLHSHVGYAIDDPFDQDVTSGRIYNHFCFANIVYDVTPKFILGLEFTQWKTLWVGPTSPPADSSRLEFVAKYGF